MRLSLVYDRVNKWGGAERVLLALHEIWPQAPLYTAVYNPKTASWASVFRVKSSFLQYFPFAKSRHELYPMFTPLAFESFDFSSYDVVLSVTSAEAKGIITKPNTLHICYCLTPTRYLWSGYQDYLNEPGAGFFNPVARIIMKILFSPLRRWDYISSNRPDKFIAISKTVQKRIKKYYQQEASVIYPPVDAEIFKPSSSPLKLKEDYFLVVSRLVPYKKIDYVITVFNKLGWRLKIIGTGIDERRLKSLANRNIEFISNNLTDEKLCCYYQNCRALIFPGEEDFGLTSVEAQSCGKPVIGIGQGGVSETIIAGQTGETYATPDKDSLTSALKKFSKKKYSISLCRRNAIRFSKIQFQQQMKTVVIEYWKNFCLR